LDNTTQCTSISTLDIPPTDHSHLPLPFGRWHRSGLHQSESSPRRGARFLRLNMLSANFRYTMGLPYGLLTRLYACCCMPIFVFPPPCGVRLAGGQDAITHQRQGFSLPVLPFNPVIFQRQLPRCSGPPGVSSGYFQHTIVRYMEVNHLTDRGLYPVLRTRPGLPPPQICLPSTFRYGAYLYVDPRFCLRLPSAAHHCYNLAFGYRSPPSGWI